MGYSFCQCNSLCLLKKEENLSSSNLSKKYNYNSRNINNKITNNTLSSFQSSETIQSIYRKNCVKKIIKTYLKYKKNKKKNLSRNIAIIETNNDINGKGSNKNTIISRNDSKPYSYTDQYSIYYPFYIDKIHKSKTIYEKFNIPKINNGKSLEILNRNNSGTYLVQEKYKSLKIKKK